MTITIPARSLHSSNPDILLEGYKDIITNLNVVMKNLAEFSPHGRDYKDSDSFNQAKKEHIDNFKKLKDVLDYYTSLALEVDSLKNI